MTDLTPITALGGTVARSRVFGALTLTEMPDCALASLTLHKGQTPPAPFGLTLPDVGQAVHTGAHGAFWTGPDQWMIEVSAAPDLDLAALLKDQAPGAAITEQTDGFTAFDITSSTGPGPIEDVMRKLVNIDPIAFGAGQTTRTALHHMTVFLIRRSDARLAVIGMRSYAAALWHALAVAARRLDT